MKQLFKYQNDEIAYTEWGSGSKALLMFHGFGQDGLVFTELASVFVENGYRVISFDLFFHGESKLGSDNFYLTENRLNKIISEFLVQNDISEFSLFGFSIGAKYAMAISKHMKPKKLYLMAPDGIIYKGKYSFITSNFGLRSLFKLIITKPRLLYFVLRIARFFGIITPSLYKFSRGQMDSEEKRRKVYNTWVSIRKLELNTHILRRQSTIIILGKYDRVIPEKRLLMKVGEEKGLVIISLNCGHSQMIMNLTSYLRNADVINFLK